MKHAAQYLLATLALGPALAAGPLWAQSADPNALVQNDKDTPENWCRNGQFASISADYQLGEISAKSRLMSDGDAKDAKACPSDDAKKCPGKAMIDARTPVVISKKLRNFYCVYNPKTDSSGWVTEKSVAIAPAKPVQAADWTGIWSDGTNRIDIRKSGTGLRVVGHASWQGGTSAAGTPIVNEGDLDFVARPAANKLVLKAKQDGECAAELINLGRYLIARDNSACGGMNVNFNGVYQRK